MDRPDAVDAMDRADSRDRADGVDAVDATGWRADEEDPFLSPEPYQSLPLVPAEEAPPERDPPAQANSLQEGDWFWPLLPGGARHSPSPWQVVEIVRSPNKPTLVYGQVATGKLHRWLLERCQRAEPPERKEP